MMSTDPEANTTPTLSTRYERALRSIDSIPVWIVTLMCSAGTVIGAATITGDTARSIASLMLLTVIAIYMFASTSGFSPLLLVLSTGCVLGSAFQTRGDGVLAFFAVIGSVLLAYLLIDLPASQPDRGPEL